MTDPIDREAAYEVLSDYYHHRTEFQHMALRDALSRVPSAQPERGYIDQIQWERDIAVQQLADLGYGLGEKVKTDGDCISRQVAIDALNKLNMIDTYEKDGDVFLKVRVQDVADMLNFLPSAQPEIIRCGECKHRYTEGENVVYNVCELNHNKVQPDDWYCADAERRTDGV